MVRPDRTWTCAQGARNLLGGERSPLRGRGGAQTGAPLAAVAPSVPVGGGHHVSTPFPPELPPPRSRPPHQGLRIQSHRRPHKCSRAHRPAARPPPFPAQGLGLPSLRRPIQSLEKASHLSCGRSVRPRSGVEPDAATCRPHPPGWSPASFEGRHQAPDRAQSCGGPSCWADSLSRGLRGLCPARV